MQITFIYIVVWFTIVHRLYSNPVQFIFFLFAKQMDLASSSIQCRIRQSLTAKIEFLFTIKDVFAIRIHPICKIQEPISKYFQGTVYSLRTC